MQGREAGEGLVMGMRNLTVKASESELNGIKGGGEVGDCYWKC